MARTANGRRIYALSDYTVERTSKGWYFGRTSRFGDMHAKGLLGPKLDASLLEDLTRRYVEARLKMFRLEKSRKKFRSEYRDDDATPPKPPARSR